MQGQTSSTFRCAIIIALLNSQRENNVLQAVGNKIMINYNCEIICIYLKDIHLVFIIIIINYCIYFCLLLLLLLLLL